MGQIVLCKWLKVGAGVGRGPKSVSKVRQMMYLPPSFSLNE